MEQLDRNHKQQQIDHILNYFKEKGYIIISYIPNCGKFGLVYPMEKNGKKFALKILLNDNKYHDDNDIERELQSLLKIKDIKNKNILTLHEYYYPNDKKSIGLVTEFYPKTLQNMMERFCYKKTKQSKYIQFSLQEAKNVIIQLLNGYYYLLKESIIHRDIKPENIFIDKNGLYILGDFGSSKQSNKDTSKNITIRGTMPYIAPEILQVNYGIKQEYDYKCDIFSFGVLLYQLIACELPVKNIRDQKKYVQNQLKKEVDNINFDLIQDENAKDVIQKMLQFEPSDRIDFHTLIVHNFFNNDKDLQNKGFFTESQINFKINKTFSNLLQSSISEKDQIIKKVVKVVVDQNEQLDTIDSMKETDSDQSFVYEPPVENLSLKQMIIHKINCFNIIINSLSQIISLKNNVEDVGFLCFIIAKKGYYLYNELNLNGFEISQESTEQKIYYYLVNNKNEHLQALNKQVQEFQQQITNTIIKYMNQEQKQELNKKISEFDDDSSQIFQKQLTSYIENLTLFTKVKQQFNDQNLDEDAKQLKLQKLRGYLIETLQIDYYIENYEVDIQLNNEKIQYLPLEQLINYNDQNYNNWKQK